MRCTYLSFGAVAPPNPPRPCVGYRSERKALGLLACAMLAVVLVQCSIYVLGGVVVQ